MLLGNKTKNGLLQVLIVAGLIVSAMTLSTAAAEMGKDALKARFKARFATLVSLKDAGKIGETTAGIIEAVTKEAASEPAVKVLVDEENADRMSLYALLAKDTGTTGAEVAKRNAMRLFRKAKRGHYLKAADGTWHQKR